MADERIQGKRYTLYVTTTDPSTVKGSDPEHDPSNYTKVGKVVNLNPSSSWSPISISDRDSGAVVDELPDELTVGLDVTVNVQREDSAGSVGEDAGHDILIDAHDPDNQDVVYWLINPEDPQETTITGMNGVYSRGRVLDWSPGFDMGSAAQYSFTLGSAGQKLNKFVTS